MSIDDAVRWMRSHRDYADTIRDTYLEEDVLESAQRFAASAEFSAVVDLLNNDLQQATILDLGAGRGIASWAFARAGAKKVYAVEPDPSSLVGYGALRPLCRDLRVETIPSFADNIPVADSAVDIVYARQVLHHLPDLHAAMKECARILRPGGLFLACREHVIFSQDDLPVFLEAHPMHRLAGGENAYRASEYRDAMEGAGLRLQHEYGPWDSIINAYPAVRSPDELEGFWLSALERKIGALSSVLGLIPGAAAICRARLRRPRPGELHTYVARKTVSSVP